jgi:membrane protein implicated in regulation of membrane protease activity
MPRAIGWVAVAAVAAVVAVAALLWWLIGPAATPVAPAVALAAQQAMARREKHRQAAQEAADEVIGGLGPAPETLRQGAAQEDAEIAAHVDEVPVGQLLDDWRGRRG